jgi:hypothetical protein
MVTYFALPAVGRALQDVCACYLTSPGKKWAANFRLPVVITSLVADLLLDCAFRLAFFDAGQLAIANRQSAIV